MRREISIITVNWNSGAQLADALRSIEDHAEGLVELVVVVDNASTDDSLIRATEAGPYSFELKILRNKSNRGFAAACNQGASLATTEYLLFLNPDTRLFAGTLRHCVNFMDDPRNTKVGICGVKLLDEFGRASTSAAHFPTLRVILGRTFHLHTIAPRIFPKHLLTADELGGSRPVDQIMGAYFFIRRRLFEDCDGFDERFFVYYEEVDLSLRAKQRDYISYYLADASAFHRGGGCSQAVKAMRLHYTLRSRLLYGRKHFTVGAFACLAAITVLELPLRVLRGVIRRAWDECWNSVLAYFYLVKSVATRGAGERSSKRH